MDGKSDVARMRQGAKISCLNGAIAYYKRLPMARFAAAPAIKASVMGFYDAWPCLLITIIIVFFADTPALQSVDVLPKSTPARVDTVDGLRGFLALGVFFSHTASYHQYLLTERWMLPPSRLYSNLGQSGVVIFFMITGYLFWMRLLKTQGKPGLFHLYIGRAFRIVPLYLLLVSIVFLSVGVLTEWHVKETNLALLGGVARWLAGGVVLSGAVNGIETINISAGVTWSLTYEWKFYASLLLTSLFARQLILGALLPVIGLLVAVPLLTLHPGNLDLACIFTFLVGMTAASFKHSVFVEAIIKSHYVRSMAVIGCVAVALLVFDVIYDVPSIIALGMAFWLIVSGTTVFGLLLTRSAKRLGDISYGIYLLQGPVLFLAFSLPPLRSIAIASPWGHWLTVMMAGIALVILATITHHFIEKPGIVAGQRVIARLAELGRKRRIARMWRTRVKLVY